jgi:hypothetical protein
VSAAVTAQQQLAAFLSTSTDAEAELRLGALLDEHAAPLVRRIASRRLGNVPGDIEDVRAQVMLQLLVRLRRERSDSTIVTIDAFSSYVVTAAHHGCDHYVRARYPLRWRLRNRIRHVLKRDARFAIWKASDVWTCGLAVWRGQPPLLERPPATSLADVAAGRIPELLVRLFPTRGGPLELTAIVDAAAVAWGIPLFQHDEGARLELLADGVPRVDNRLDQRARLDAVWAQVRELPLRQRHAVLLNLRDDAITLFLTSGAASLRDIAEALEMPLDEFAALWNDLPLPDAVIAERLGCTRQQVINLRMAARKRLAHRLAAKANIGKGPPL